MNRVFKLQEHTADLCVVGGGLAGMCAAISAARRGLKTVIMHDRPVFGGNASSEIRMWICGAQGVDKRETGIVEEIELKNMHRNPYRTYPIWDTLLYEMIKQEKNITAIMNCSCNDIEMNGNKIEKIMGWQTTTQKWHSVSAEFFADCSGDSILAPLSGAMFRMGREKRAEFGESIAPVAADDKTMGLSCLIQTRQTNEKRPYTAPKWAYKYTKEELEPYRLPHIDEGTENFWFMELGGEQNTIEDTEEIRDELLMVATGIWDYIKNSGDCSADEWEMDFLGFLPGKRESRRYVGDYIMTQHDVEAEGRFEDIIAYGGWSMDDHNPKGIKTDEPPTIYNPAPSPYGIPYRCIYSKNIDNLFFAGRNISVTHSAMSSTRVMATCAILGQAVGTAAQIAHKYGLNPRGVYKERIHELQQELLKDDCYLPFVHRDINPIMKKCKIFADCNENPYVLINGEERNMEENGIVVAKGGSITLEFDRAYTIGNLRIVLDSDINRLSTGSSGYMPNRSTISGIPLNPQRVHLPDCFARNMTIQYRRQDDEWCNAAQITDNELRLLKIPVDRETDGIKIIFDSAWGSDKINVFSVDIV